MQSILMHGDPVVSAIEPGALPMHGIELSVVTTMYRSEAYVEQFYIRTVGTLEKLGIEKYEIIFVDDGSPDQSRELALKLFNRDHKVVVIDLSRNFGHHKAIMTGLSYARGARVFLLDCDLEEDPELLELLSGVMQKRNCDVVFGFQKMRRGGFLERMLGNVYFRLMKSVSGIDFPANVLTLRLMTRRYVNSLLLHTERELLISGIWHLTGYEQVAVPVIKHTSSPTSYSIAKRVGLVVTSVISYSDRPLRWIFYIGLSMVLLAALYMVYILAVYVMFGSQVLGYASLIMSLWLIGGLNFLFLGTIGIYIATIFSETKQRPYTIVRDVYRHESR